MKKIPRDIGVAALMLFAVACTRPANLDNVAVGQDVAITKTNGGVVEGKVTREGAAYAIDTALLKAKYSPSFKRPQVGLP